VGGQQTAAWQTTRFRRPTMRKAELEAMNAELIDLLTAIRDQIDDTLESLGANDDDCDDIPENDDED
jgi:hypothetical protein